MSYQVLARKWRPRSFQEMVGQEHILRMLTNALDNQRLHHAYLYTGTRGVGKTTLARIFSKCLNCESGITSKPCGTCKTCTSIDAGKFLDLIEVDAASRTKVEDTRELLDNVQYAPVQGRYKIYLIDEVHMLSGHSFNALLKTLEEPPSYVKFLLATTDPKRLPVTILSRCLQFNLKRVPIDKITQHLAHICTTENITFEAPALQLVASAADGSMRDALSLLDQTIAFCQEKIITKDTQIMLGSIEQDAIFRLLDALAEHNGQQLMQEITQLAEYAPNFTQVLDDLLSTLHQINVVQLIGNAEGISDAVKQFAERFSAEDVQLYYQIALIGRRDLTISPNPQHGFEMTMLRMLAFQPVTTEYPKTTPTKNNAPTRVSTPPKPDMPTQKREPVSTAAPTSTPIDITPDNWRAILPQLGLTGMSLALASNCTVIQVTASKIDLALAQKHAATLNKKMQERLEEALTRYMQKPMKLDVKIAKEELQTPAKHHQQEQEAKHASATEAIKQDTHVQTIVDLFGATLDVNSIEAVD